MGTRYPVPDSLLKDAPKLSYIPTTNPAAYLNTTVGLGVVRRRTQLASLLKCLDLESLENLDEQLEDRWLIVTLRDVLRMPTPQYVLANTACADKALQFQAAHT